MSIASVAGQGDILEAVLGDDYERTMADYNSMISDVIGPQEETDRMMGKVGNKTRGAAAASSASAPSMSRSIDRRDQSPVRKNRPVLAFSDPRALMTGRCEDFGASSSSSSSSPPQRRGLSEMDEDRRYRRDDRDYYRRDNGYNRTSSTAPRRSPSPRGGRTPPRERRSPPSYHPPQPRYTYERTVTERVSDYGGRPTRSGHIPDHQRPPVPPQPPRAEPQQHHTAVKVPMSKILCCDDDSKRLPPSMDCSPPASSALVGTVHASLARPVQPEPIVVAPVFTESSSATSASTPQSAMAEAPAPQKPQESVKEAAPAPAVVAVTKTESLGPPDQAPPSSTTTEAIANITGFVNMSQPSSKPTSDITDMAPLRVLRAEFNAQRHAMASENIAVMASVEGTLAEVPLSSSSGVPLDPTTEASSTSLLAKAKTADEDQGASKAVHLAETADIIKASEIQQQEHEEAKKKRAAKEAKEAEEKTKPKKKKKKNKDNDEKATEKEEAPKEKKKKKKHKKDKDDEKKDKKHKKKKHKKDKDTTDAAAVATDGDKEGTKKKKKHKKKKEKSKKDKKKEKRRKERRAERKKEREERLIADEASEADSDEDIEKEEGSLSSDERAAEEEVSSIASDSGDALSESDSEADLDGNLSGFIDDKVVYEAGAEDDSDAEEIHGRNEHQAYMDKAPRLLGKSARRLKKFAEEQEGGGLRKKKAAEESSDVDMHKSDDIAALLRKEAEEHGERGGTSKGHKRRIDEEEEGGENGASGKPKKSTATAASASGDKDAENDNDNKKVDLPLVPTGRNGTRLETLEQLQPLMYELALCMVGYSIATWHISSGKNVKRAQQTKAGYGVFYDDFTSHTYACERGMVALKKLAATSTFRYYFAPDFGAPQGEEKIDEVCLNGLAMRIIKELVRLGMIPEHIIEALQKGEAPTLAIKSTKQSDEICNLKIFVCDKLIHEMQAVPELVAIMEKVTLCYKAFSVFVNLAEEFACEKLGAKFVDQESPRRVTRSIIKSYEDIHEIVSGKFVSVMGDKIHKAAETIISTAIDAKALLADLRQG